MMLNSIRRRVPDHDFGWTKGADYDVVHKELIYSGPSSHVHKMLDTRNGQLFARKLLVHPLGDMSQETLLNEARVIAKLYENGVPKNLVGVMRHGYLPQSIFYYIDMELCDNNLDNYISDMSNDMHTLIYHSLSTRLSRSTFQKRRVLDIWDIMEQMLNGIRFIHGCGEVHRDLKPSNILFSSVTNTWKLTDFGFTAEGTSSQANSTRYARGTASYRAPELVKEKSEYSNKVDIFAAGCILYELVTAGKKAFQSDFGVLQYSFSPSKMKIPFVGVPESTKAQLSDLIHIMLQSNWSKRPSSTDLWRQFFQHRSIALGDAWLDKVDWRQLKEYRNVYASEDSPLDLGNITLLERAHCNIGDFNSVFALIKNAIKRLDPTPAFKTAFRRARRPKFEKYISQCIKSIRTQTCMAASDLRFICWMSHLLVIVATSAFAVSWSKIYFFDYPPNVWKYWWYRVANIGSVISWGILSCLETNAANLENKWSGVTCIDNFGAPSSEPLTEMLALVWLGTKPVSLSLLPYFWASLYYSLIICPNCIRSPIVQQPVGPLTCSRQVVLQLIHVLLLFTTWGPGYITAIWMTAWFQIPWSLLLLIVGTVLISMPKSWPMLAIGTVSTGILMILKSLYTFYYYVLSGTPEPRPELAVILGMHSVNLLVILPCLVLSIVGEYDRMSSVIQLFIFSGIILRKTEVFRYAWSFEV